MLAGGMDGTSMTEAEYRADLFMQFTASGNESGAGEPTCPDNCMNAPANVQTAYNDFQAFFTGQYWQHYDYGLFLNALFDEANMMNMMDCMNLETELTQMLSDLQNGTPSTNNMPRHEYEMARKDEILENLYEKTTPAPVVPLDQFKIDKMMEFLALNPPFEAKPDPMIPVVPSSCGATVPEADIARQQVVDQWNNVINPVWYENAYYDSLCE